MDVLTSQVRNLAPQCAQPALTQEQRDLLEKYPHYYKDISQLAILDVYRVLDLFDVTDACAQHAAKKLLCAGVRGAKDMLKDIKEARDTLNRKLLMLQEDAQGELNPIRALTPPPAPPAEDQGLQPHEQRVAQEHAELVERKTKLWAFTCSHEFNGLPDVEKQLLTDQLAHMTRYATVLDRRLTIYRHRAQKAGA